MSRRFTYPKQDLEPCSHGVDAQGRVRVRCAECRAAQGSVCLDCKSAPRVQYARCRQCARQYVRLRKMGISSERFEELLELQDSCCAICQREFDLEARGSSGRVEQFYPRIDHDHGCCPRGRSCGRCVRGLLCGGCNVALGLFADDPVRLLRAVDYLVRPIRVETDQQGVFEEC